ncbi:MAG: tetratricopeptide repeat protein [Acidobacteriota bacterium]
MNRFLILLSSISFAIFNLSCGGAQSSTAGQNASVPTSNLSVDSPSPTNSGAPVNSDSIPATATSMDYVRQGTAAYVAHDFARAIPPYEKALDLEKKDRRLDRKVWLVLVDNLAMAYGLTDNIKGSLSVLEYGISKEPTYPMFYYHKACGYGENGDEENALKYLRLAAKYKAYMIPGENYPDPSTDNSFRKFADSDKFKKELASLK